jgi:hypothetical protein
MSAGDWPRRLAGRAAWRRPCPSGEGARHRVRQWRRFGNGLTAAGVIGVGRGSVVGGQRKKDPTACRRGARGRRRAGPAMKSMSKGLGVLRERRADPLAFPNLEAWNVGRMYHFIPRVATQSAAAAVCGLKAAVQAPWVGRQRSRGVGPGRPDNYRRSRGKTSRSHSCFSLPVHTAPISGATRRRTHGCTGNAGPAIGSPGSLEPTEGVTQWQISTR